MPEESPPSPHMRALLQEVLRLAILTDSLLDDGPYTIEEAFELRQESYDVLKRLEKAPRTPSTDGLMSVAIRCFTSLQERLSLPARWDQ